MEAFRRLSGAGRLCPFVPRELVVLRRVVRTGLAGLGQRGRPQNLLPKEITLDRLIDRKRPWAVAAAAALLLGCSISFAAYSLALGRVDAYRWQAAETQASQPRAMPSG